MIYNFILSACQNVSRQILLRAACVSLGILIVWQFSSALLYLYGLNKNTTRYDRAALVARSSSPLPVSNRGLNAPFFGQYTPVMNHVGDVKQSLLTYKVVGIMLAAHDEDSEVMMDTLSGGYVVYHVGDTLPLGNVIKKITSEGIFVERNGELESLSLPKNELIFEPPAKPL